MLHVFRPESLRGADISFAPAATAQHETATAVLYEARSGARRHRSIMVAAESWGAGYFFAYGRDRGGRPARVFFESRLQRDQKGRLRGHLLVLYVDLPDRVEWRVYGAYL